MMSELSRGEIEGTNHNEIAMAALADLEAYGEIRYSGGKFWQWGGSHWHELIEQKIIAHLAQNYSKYPACKKFSDHKGCLSVLRNNDDVNRELCQAGLQGINFANGFLTKTGELLPHNPDFGMTYVLPYAYRPELSTSAPRWFKMLQDFWGEDEDYRDKIKLLQEAFAVTMFGVSTEYQKAFTLFGVAHSGKTQIRYVLEGLMPKGCVSTIPPNDWSDKFLPTGMVGKLLNVAGEISDNDMIDGPKLKQIVCGEAIQAQYKHGQTFEFEPRCAQWFLGNHLPRSKDNTKGFTRRFIFLKFCKAFPTTAGVKVNDYWKVVIQEEREAIAAWAVEGMQGLIDQGHHFTEPASHLELESRMAERNDNVRLFIKGLRENLQVILGEAAHVGRSVNWTSIDALYSAYPLYCYGFTGVSAVALSNCTERLAEIQADFGFRLSPPPVAKGVTKPGCSYLTLVPKGTAPAA